MINRQVIEEYNVSIYGRIVYFLKTVIFVLFTPLAGAMFHDFGPYNDPGMFAKSFFSVIGVTAICMCINNIYQVLRFSPRVLILDNGLEYRGILGKKFIAWNKIISFYLLHPRGGYTYLSIKVQGSKRASMFDVSAMNPSYENLVNQIEKNIRGNSI